jgi:hypothetical protein
LKSPIVIPFVFEPKVIPVTGWIIALDREVGLPVAVEVACHHPGHIAVESHGFYRECTVAVAQQKCECIVAAPGDR